MADEVGPEIVSILAPRRLPIMPRKTCSQVMLPKFNIWLHLPTTIQCFLFVSSFRRPVEVVRLR